MNKFTAIVVETQPNLKRIEEYANRYGMTLEEALQRKRIGEDYFPIRDQQVVSAGVLNFINKEDKISIMAAVFVGEEKKVLDAFAERLEKNSKSNRKTLLCHGRWEKIRIRNSCRKGYVLHDRSEKRKPRNKAGTSKHDKNHNKPKEWIPEAL